MLSERTGDGISVCLLCAFRAEVARADIQGLRASPSVGSSGGLQLNFDGFISC